MRAESRGGGHGECEGKSQGKGGVEIAMGERVGVVVRPCVRANAGKEENEDAVPVQRTRAWACARGAAARHLALEINTKSLKALLAEMLNVRVAVESR